MNRTGLLGLVLLAAVSAAAAQTGGLQVTVQDEAGPLPGATVVLRSDRGYVAETALMTNAKGIVVFPVLRAGDGYSVEVSFPGLNKIRKGDIHISSGQTLQEIVQLSPQLTEQVKVTAERDVIDLDKTEASTKFSDDFIQDLPVSGRQYQNIITMAPGVNDDNDDGQPTVHGSRARDFKPIVSGVAAVDPLTGRIMGDVNADSIEEMEVITAGAGVEFGRAQGGYMRIIQKQGSNQFEGTFQLLLASDELAASSSRGALSQPDYVWYQPAIQVSGPIVKDKLWYRLSHEYRYIEAAIDIANGTTVQTYEQVLHSDQLTWQVSPRNKLAFQYDSDPFEVDNVGVSSLVPPSSARSQEYGGDKYTVRWTAPYSPKILVETVAAYQDYYFGMAPSDPNAANNCITDPTKPALVHAYCRDNVEQTVSGPFFRTWADERQRFTLSGSATLYGGRFLGANHQIKMGLAVENERYYREVTDAPRITRFLSLDTPASSGTGTIGDGDEGEEDSFTGGIESRSETFLLTVASPTFSAASSTGTNWGAYIEDQIKPTNNTTLTIGVRIDQESLRSDGYRPFDPAAELETYEAIASADLSADAKKALSYATFTGFLDLTSFNVGLAEQVDPTVTSKGCSSVQNVWCGFNTLMNYVQRPDDIVLDNTNVSPNINFAWLPWANGKTKLQAYWGRHFNNLFLAVPLVERDPRTADMDMTCFTDYTEDGVQTCAAGGGNNVVPNQQVVDRNLKTPYQDEWGVQIERELWAETSIRLAYLNRQYKDQLQDIDINHAPGDYGTCVPPDDRNPREPSVTGDPDGIIDDCVGTIVPSGVIESITTLNTTKDIPDGIPDLYVQNPIWGNIYLVGNFNEAEYQAIILDFTRRQYRGWEATGSYVYSEAKGDGEDWNQLTGDDQSLLEDEKGFQSNDRRHFLKVAATTITPWGFRFGTTVQWLSGLPYSLLTREVSRDAIPPSMEGVGSSVARNRVTYDTGTRNDQRNKSYWEINLKFTKEIQLPHGMNLQLSADVFNLLDERTYVVYNRGNETGRRINGRNEAYVTQGRRLQLTTRLTF